VTERSRLETARGNDRPRAHEGARGPELAIFDATERLLAEVPVYELSVAQIVTAAGVSRATFYFYFSSKFAVVTGLLARVMDEIYLLVQPYVQRKDGTPPERALRSSLESAIAVWSNHRLTLRAAHEHWHAITELGTLWLGVVERFTDALSAEIDRQRVAGLAPDGPNSRQLAAALLWGTERCLFVAGLGVDKDLAGEQEILEPLLALWLGAIYGGQPSDAAQS
jgi:AcrR family transcriptional regulator